MSTLEHLKDALETLHQALEEVESALIEFEEVISGEVKGRSVDRAESDILSIPELCQELGMGKSWVYRKIKSGEIPSIKLGDRIKVKRSDLEEYLESNRYHPQVSQ